MAGSNETGNSMTPRQMSLADPKVVFSCTSTFSAPSRYFRGLMRILKMMGEDWARCTMVACEVWQIPSIALLSTARSGGGSRVRLHCTDVYSAAD